MNGELTRSRRSEATALLVKTVHGTLGEIQSGSKVDALRQHGRQIRRLEMVRQQRLRRGRKCGAIDIGRRQDDHQVLEMERGQTDPIAGRSAAVTAQLIVEQVRQGELVGCREVLRPFRFVDRREGPEAAPRIARDVDQGVQHDRGTRAVVDGDLGKRDDLVGGAQIHFHQGPGEGEAPARGHAARMGVFTERIGTCRGAGEVGEDAVIEFSSVILQPDDQGTRAADVDQGIQRGAAIPVLAAAANLDLPAAFSGEIQGNGQLMIAARLRGDMAVQAEVRCGADRSLVGLRVVAHADPLEVLEVAGQCAFPAAVAGHLHQQGLELTSGDVQRIHLEGEIRLGDVLNIHRRADRNIRAASRVHVDGTLTPEAQELRLAPAVGPEVEIGFLQGHATDAEGRGPAIQHASLEHVLAGGAVERRRADQFELQDIGSRREREIHDQARIQHASRAQELERDLLQRDAGELLRWQAVDRGRARRGKRRRHEEVLGNRPRAACQAGHIQAESAGDDDLVIPRPEDTGESPGEMARV